MFWKEDPTIKRRSLFCIYIF